MAAASSRQLLELKDYIRSSIANLSAAHAVVLRAAPGIPSVDYSFGFSTGHRAGQLEALASILATLTESHIDEILRHAAAQAAVEGLFPFEMHIETV